MTARSRQNELELMVALMHQGRNTEVEPLARRFTERFPEQSIGWQILGAALHALGRYQDSVQPLRWAAEAMPAKAALWYNLGVSCQATRENDEAERSFRLAIDLDPSLVKASDNLGQLLLTQGRLAESEMVLRAAVGRNQFSPETLNNLAVALQQSRKWEDSERLLSRAIELKPDTLVFHLHRGNALREMGRLEEAAVAYRYVIQLTPDSIQAHRSLGLLYQEQGRYVDARTHLIRATQLHPNDTDLQLNLIGVLVAQGDIATALAQAAHVLAVFPDRTDAWSAKLFALNYEPDISGETIVEAYREFDRKHDAPHRTSRKKHKTDNELQRRLRIGYVSPDFRRHVVTYFLEPLLANHDHDLVEVYAYAELEKDDDVTERYQGYVDHWIPIKELSDDALAERIRADGIDILVDLAGHTKGNRLLVLARKPAPVSVSWLGYGYTTGVSAIDYLLTDATSAPEGSEHLFAEKPWRLEKSAFAYRPAEGMGHVTGLPAKERGYITFGTLTRAIRLNHRVVRVWSEILKQVPTARLYIDSKNYTSTDMQDVLAERFAVHGIERERLEIGYHSPPWDVLRGTDITLDCFPHNSGTTLFESLYMGVPYVTLAGRPSVGRLGSSILEGVGHPEWIAWTEDEYIEKVVEMASDLDRLAATRAALRSEMEQSPLMDEVGFARRIEAAYRSMWEHWCKEVA